MSGKTSDSLPNLNRVFHGSNAAGLLSDFKTQNSNPLQQLIYNNNHHHLQEPHLTGRLTCANESDDQYDGNTLYNNHEDGGDYDNGAENYDIDNDDSNNELTAGT